MTNHKVLGDLLHVLIVEEGVEAQLVCSRVGGGGTSTGIMEREDGRRKQGSAIVSDTREGPAGGHQRRNMTQLFQLNIQVFCYSCLNLGEL